MRTHPLLICATVTLGCFAALPAYCTSLDVWANAKYMGGTTGTVQVNDPGGTPPWGGQASARAQIGSVHTHAQAVISTYFPEPQIALAIAITDDSFTLSMEGTDEGTVEISLTPTFTIYANSDTNALYSQAEITLIATLGESVKYRTVSRASEGDAQTEMTSGVPISIITPFSAGQEIGVNLYLLSRARTDFGNGTPPPGSGANAVADMSRTLLWGGITAVR